MLKNSVKSIRNLSSKYAHLFHQPKCSYHSVFDLKNYRNIVSVKGPDSATYLQNLITNNINLLDDNVNKADGKQNSLYAMILNNRGRLMYDVIIYQNKTDRDEYLIEFDTRFVNDAMRLLKMLKVKKKVMILKFNDLFFKIFNYEIILKIQGRNKQCH